MAVPSETVMNTNLDDPITKAVVDNIMGNLPTKKPLVRCEDCDLSFTSQAVLDTHLQGARHAKQVRSKNIMATLEETKISFSKDEETNGLKCNVCNVCLNSIQQLQTHLNGTRHKKKLMRGEWDGKEVVTQGPSLKSTGSAQQSVPVKRSLHTCEICNKFFNSPSQYTVHMNSEKHADKVKRSRDPNKGFLPYPYRRKAKRNIASRNQISSLSNSFVSNPYFTYQP
ncbi:zinc finger protein 346-like isoform X1 [Temnothorax curvispinosus]|uniref:Zinc finger protein 346-like isoform X1 n=1 Tax=Temnothorax curvispinosus TaxID=300111 RepID=A0A6J1RCK0_9HYME|nr:zinc finger protein 346-like isoform X1 [Temnothorax curvispinosus]XP_024890509.1 zinc finger protein 346-like isoform X1 [Temnothorax curvispinosus]XP_024890510.1 zinc finger protein 346-like isoform X1 [Temnothorax curvispinosus]